MNVARDLFVAYLSMGALQMLDKDGGKIGEALNEAGWGQYELIQQTLTSCMPVLEYLRVEHAQYDGIYLYDVVEPLGMYFVLALHHTGQIPKDMTLLAKARKYAE